MRKGTLVSLLVIFCCTSVSASPDWVKAIIEASKSDSIAADAPAYVLYDHARVEVGDNDKSEVHSWLVISLRSPAAEESVQFELKISGENRIQRFKAWQIKPDGSENDFGEKDLAQFSLFEGTALHHDTKSLKLMIPDLDVGDVLAYEYKVESKGLSSRFHQFAVQRDLPTRDVEFALKIPDKWEYQLGGSFYDSMQYSVEGKFHVWKIGNLPYRQPEAYMPEDGSETRAFAVNCYDSSDRKDEQFATWSDVARWYNRNLPERTGKLNIPSDLFPENDVVVGDTNGIFELDCHLVRDKIRYVGVEIGEGRFRPRTPELTIENRYGDCKDKAFLLQSMLNEDGVNSYLTLANFPGSFDPKITSPYQFNHIILAVDHSGFELPTDIVADTSRYLFFDPTYPPLEPGEVPRYLQADYAVVLRPDTAEVVVLPSATPESYLEERKAELTIYSNDSLAGSVSFTFHGRAAGVERYRRESIPRDKQIEELASLLGSAVVGLEIDNYEPFDFDSTVGFTANVTGTVAGSMAGGMYLLRTDPIVEAPVNLLRTDIERLYPIWFGEMEEINCEVIWHVPPEWEIEIPDSAYSASCLSSSLSATVEAPDSSTIVWKSQYRNDGQVLQAGQILEAARFEKARNAAYGSRTLLNIE